MDTPRTLAEWRAWLVAAPAGTCLDASAALRMLEDLDVPESAPEPAERPSAPPSWTWRERLWACPAEARLGVPELCEALGKPESWIYRKTSAKHAEKTGEPQLPHGKLDGSLIFKAGEIRAWLRSEEEIVQAGPMESSRGELRVIGGGR